MKKKNIVIIVLIAVVLIGTVFAFRLMADHRNEREGQEKFANALSELRTSEPQYDNPCLGTSVLRNFSYTELNRKTLIEIKNLAKMDPGSC